MTATPSPCPICGTARAAAFRATLLGRHLVSYHLCNGCGLLQTEKPYWLAEAYAEAVADTDTGVLVRNLEVGRSLRVLYSWFLRSRGPYLDIAGGYGLLTRHLRDQGFDCYWSDPYASNLVARGFDWRGGEPCTAVSAVEVLEHVEDPVSFIRSALGEARCSTIVFTTVLFEGEPPPDDWWYYAPASGQHISFYQRRTLQHIADLLGLRLYSRGSLHMLTDRRGPKWLFALATSRLVPLLATLTARRFPSLTEPDHLALRSRRRPSLADAGPPP